MGPELNIIYHLQTIFYCITKSYFFCFFLPISFGLHSHPFKIGFLYWIYIYCLSFGCRDITNIYFIENLSLSYSKFCFCKRRVSLSNIFELAILFQIGEDQYYWLTSPRICQLLNHFFYCQSVNKIEKSQSEFPRGLRYFELEFL